jgi:hypothetical protein
MINMAGKTKVGNIREEGLVQASAKELNEEIRISAQEILDGVKCDD